MKLKPKPEAVVWDIKRVTRRKYSADEKIRISVEGIGETAIAVSLKIASPTASILLPPIGLSRVQLYPPAG